MIHLGGLKQSMLTIFELALLADPGM